MELKSIHSIILDASPILNNIPSISSLLAQSEKLYTVPSIIDEIKDASARARLKTTVLPFLTIQTPKPESIKFVADFSRKTGDYSVLSKPDIQILALAYELECERNGGDWRLRQNPGQKGLNGPPPIKTEKGYAEVSEPQKELSSALDQSVDNVSHDGTNPMFDEVYKCGAQVETDLISASVEALQMNDSDPMHSQKPSFSAPESVIDTGGQKSEVDSDASDSGSDGWITPSNLKKQQAKDNDTSIVSNSEGQVMAVATITADFAMQVSSGAL